MQQNKVDWNDIDNQTERSPLSITRQRQHQDNSDRIPLQENYFSISVSNTMGRRNNGYDDVPTDLEDGTSIGNGEDNFSDEGSDPAENPGLVRSPSRSRQRGNYESVATNHGYTPRATVSGYCFGCASVLCQTVVVVTAMLMVGTMGYLLGSANPDLMITTLNSTAGIDLTAMGGTSGAVSVIGVQDVDSVDVVDNQAQTGCEDKTLVNETADIFETKKTSVKVRYDPSAALANGDSANPFDSPPKSKSPLFMTPPHPFSTGTSSSADDLPAPVGFLRHPHLVGDRLVFLSEGDAYVTTLNENSAMPASKVTTTIGNVLDPKWHPTLPLLAYTATYSGRRDVYLMDLSPNAVNKSPTRLTYWDVGSSGVNGVVGWIKTGDGSGEHADALVFRAVSNDISLPDYRLYVLHLSSNPSISGESTSASASVLEIEPVPLAQAMDAARFQKCWYFVRVKQSSNTIRYVGGTAENLWKYCDSTDPGSSSSQPLLADDEYRGTSKSPQLYSGKKDQMYLFFLSDRDHNPDSKTSKQNPWIPDRMNIWALPLSANDSNDKKAVSYSMKDLIQITDTACDFEGKTIREYSVDETTGNLVVRIGADLYFMSPGKVESKIKAGSRNRFLEEIGDEEKEQQTAIESEMDDVLEDEEVEKENDDIEDTEAPTASEVKDTEAPTASEVKDTEAPTASEVKGTEAPTVSEVKDTEAPTETEVKDTGAPTASAVKDTIAPTETETETKEAEKEIAEEVGEVGESADIAVNSSDDGNSTEPPAKYFYDFESPELVSRHNYEQGVDHFSGQSADLKRLPIVVYSDFHNDQERLVPVDIMDHFTSGDVYHSLTGSTQMLMTLRGQLWVAPVTDDNVPLYEDAGINLPARRYRVAPGAMMGGSTRILAAIHVPNPVEDYKSDRRLAVIVATDPLTPTAEHAFYLVETQASASPLFVDMEQLPKPFLGGMVSGGSTREGGLGSVKTDTLAMSPCGNRMAWSDTDGRIVVMNLPQYQDLENGSVDYVVLPKKNELDEPMIGDDVDLTFSPGGRYLSIEHHAKNRFKIISIADLGDPLGEENKIADIALGRIVQATASRFNSVEAYWGKTPTDIHDFKAKQTMASLLDLDEPDDVSTTLYFLSDRDILTDVTSPWGYRQKMPHFVTSYAVYTLPLQPKEMDEPSKGQFRGSGGEELQVDSLLERQSLIKAVLDAKKGASTSSRREKRKLAQSLHPLAGAFGYAAKAFDEQKRRKLAGSKEVAGDDKSSEDDDNDHLEEAVFEKDMDIDFGAVDLTFARSAYRLSNIPAGNYAGFVCQCPDGSLSLVEDGHLSIFKAEGFPSDKYTKKTFEATKRKIVSYSLSTNRKFVYLVYAPDGALRVVPNSEAGMASLQGDLVLDENVVDKDGLYLSIWPTLEYRQLYDDAWRMMRDYFYDPDMTGIDWLAIHERFLPLVERCSKREELDDVLIQMASELSALHVFVYGGEYNSPMHGDEHLEDINEVGSLGAILRRTPAWKGYTVMSIPEVDPDFTMIDHSISLYSPLSEQSLRLSGQRGLQVGDVIVGVNGESVMSVPDIHMLLRGTAGRSIRLDVLRLASGATADLKASKETEKNDSKLNDNEAAVESLVTAPLSPSDNYSHLYKAWEWKTEQLAEKLASDAGISVGYIHLQSMSGVQAEDAFARGFFPNYHKQGLILDVRHNLGGNIDAWVLDVLQRKAWMYWQSRDFSPETGGIGWDEHYAFRGHVVVLVDEKTSSDGEGVSRGISELGLGRIIGKRTWGGGIWLSSDNKLVDGGIATAPEIGDYNDKFGWGMGIEQMGLEPDIEVDNDPHEVYMGRDRQLERAIEELKVWIKEEPIVVPKPKSKYKDMTMGERECKA